MFFLQKGENPQDNTDKTDREEHRMNKVDFCIKHEKQNQQRIHLSQYLSHFSLLFLQGSQFMAFLARF